MKNKFLAKNHYQEILVVDSSIILKLFLESEYDPEIGELAKMCKKKEITFIAPPLIVFEIINVLSKIYKSPEIVKKCYNKFQELGIMIHQPRRKYEDLAINYTTENSQISYYVASYHALAKEFNATFLTADQKYFNLTKNQGNIKLYQNI